MATEKLDPETPFETIRDGLTLRGLIRYPDNFHAAVDTPAPAAIIAHSFSGTARGTYRWAKHFASHGFLGIHFDFAGSGNSDGTTTDTSVLTNAADVDAVLNAVRAMPDVDSSRIVLAGCSQGGLASALIAAENPDIAGLVLYSPALCIPHDAREGQLIDARFDPANPPENFIMHGTRLSRRFIDDALSLDPYTEISRYEGPVLICHGTDDPMVSADFSREAVEHYADADLEVITGGDHVFIKSGFDQALAATDAFISRIGLNARA